MYKHRIQALAREAGFPVMDYGDPHFNLSREAVGELRIRPYLQRWQLCIEKRWFHVRMADHSIFLFQEGLKPSYSFLHCPLDLMPISEYLAATGIEDTPKERRRAAAGYASLVDTASERQHVTPIRFDFDPDGYRPGVHPVAHVHIGLENSVRISSNKMSPVSFVLFVMRHMYPASWKRLLERRCCSQYVSMIRDQVTKIEAEHWTDLDRHELYLA